MRVYEQMFKELLGHVRTVNKHLELGDAVYQVRERADMSAMPDGANSWMHPNVVEFSNAVVAISKILAENPEEEKNNGNNQTN